MNNTKLIRIFGVLTFSILAILCAIAQISILIDASTFHTTHPSESLNRLNTYAAIFFSLILIPILILSVLAIYKIIKKKS